MNSVKSETRKAENVETKKVVITGIVLIAEMQLLSLPIEHCDLYAEVEIDADYEGTFSQRDLAYHLARETADKFPQAKTLNLGGLSFTLDGGKPERLAIPHHIFMLVGDQWVSLTDILFPNATYI